jgi:hypothetical protein
MRESFSLTFCFFGDDGDYFDSQVGEDGFATGCPEADEGVE